MPFSPDQTILDLLDSWSETRADDIAFIFLDAEGKEADRCTFRELNEKVQNIGSYLVSLGATGKRVVLFFSPGLEFILPRSSRHP